MKNLALSTALLALVSGAAFAQDVVRLGTEGGYPPYNFINDAGEVAGFEREVGDAMCERAGLTCEWVLNDWDSIIPNLASGNYDAILAGMSVTPEREAVVDFTDEYYPPVKSAYIGMSEDIDVTTGVIAAQTGTIQAAFVAESDAELLEFATPDETVAAVRNGEADAVLADADFLGSQVIASNGELVFIGDGVALGGGIGAAVRTGDDALREKFNEAIASMKADGTLNELLAKWFSETGEVPQF